MKNNLKKNLLPCINVSLNEEVTLNLIKEILSLKRLRVECLLLIDTHSMTPSIEITNLLNTTGIKFTYLNLPSANELPGFILKKAIEFSYNYKFDFLIIFNERWLDGFEFFKETLKNGQYLTNSLTVVPTKPKTLNIARAFNKTINIISSYFLNIAVKDTKGDSINIFKVSSFYQEDDDKIFLISDNRWYFYDLLALISYHKMGIHFLKPCPIVTHLSPIKINSYFFLKSIQLNFKYILNKDKFIKKYKGHINPRTIQIAETKNKSLSEESFEQELELSTNDKVATDNNTQDIFKLPFINQDKVDPDSKIVRLDHIDPKNKDVIVINWCLTNICNYRCSYCPENLHNGTEKGPSLDDIKNFFYKIQSYHPSKTLFFEFTGGEVTYYRDFLPLIKFIKENGGDVGIISNGARKLNIWEKFYPYIDHICLSFHSEQGDPEHFYNVVSYLTGKMTTHVNIMMKPEKFDICYNLAQNIASNCEVSIAMQPLLEGMDGALYNYTQEQKKILDSQSLNFSDNPQFKRKENFHENIYRGAMLATLSNNTTTAYSSPELISRDMNRWSNWECYTGVENISVGMNGDIYRGWCMVGGTIGNISDKDLELPKTPIICNKSQCSCGQDIMCTKVKVY